MSSASSPFPFAKLTVILFAVIWTIRSDSRVRWPREHLPSSSRPSRPNNANRSTPRVRDTKLTSNNTRSNPLPPSNPTASPAEVLQTANTTKKSCVVCPRCWIWYIPRGGCVGLYEFGSPGSLEGLRPDPSVLGSSHTPHTTPVPFFPSLLNATYRPLRGGDDLEGEGFYKKTHTTLPSSPSYPYPTTPLPPLPSLFRCDTLTKLKVQHESVYL